MQLVGAVAELHHVAKHEPAGAAETLECVEPCFQRARIRVVGIVDENAPLICGFEIEASRNRAYCGESRDEIVERRTRCRGDSGGAKRVPQVVHPPRPSVAGFVPIGVTRSKSILKPDSSPEAFTLCAMKSAGCSKPNVNALSALRLRAKSARIYHRH